jgi:hypothetical protein
MEIQTLFYKALLNLVSPAFILVIDRADLVDLISDLKRAVREVVLVLSQRVLKLVAIRLQLFLFYILLLDTEIDSRAGIVDLIDHLASPLV